MDNILLRSIEPGVQIGENLLEDIVKYSGDIMIVGVDLGVDVEILGEGYAILTLTVEKVQQLFDYREIEYIELPKTLKYFLTESLTRVCIPQVQSASGLGLSGSGVIVGIIDSGIDYTHWDFRNDDGTSRILYIWDQTIPGAPPAGFRSGTEYTNSQINEALASIQPSRIVPSIDPVGHGTAVTGIAAGNGRSSARREVGVAPEASIIVVKLGNTGNINFSRTTEVMRGIKYIVDKALALNMPVCMNLSYGTNNGSHDGDSLFETYIDAMSEVWKNVICVATGNEGAAAHHFSDVVQQGQVVNVEFVTTQNLPHLYLVMWKNFVDTFTLELVAPSGRSTGTIRATQRLTRAFVDGVNITVIYGQPTHYNFNQEIFILLEGDGEPVINGIWNLIVRGENIVDGRFDVWMQTIEDITRETSFLVPSVDVTLTLPSTAMRVISVGGYNALLGTSAEFTGRGYTRSNIYVKPDIVAPAVGVLTTRAGGGYDTFSGTSMAAPFVTGAAALMMEWGIVRGNDPFLYGQRLKAFLRKGATRTAGIQYPNPIWGYGRLCLNRSMQYLIAYVRGGLSI